MCLHFFYRVERGGFARAGVQRQAVQEILSSCAVHFGRVVRYTVYTIIVIDGSYAETYEIKSDREKTYGSQKKIGGKERPEIWNELRIISSHSNLDMAPLVKP